MGLGNGLDIAAGTELGNGAEGGTRVGAKDGTRVGMLVGKLVGSGVGLKIGNHVGCGVLGVGFTVKVRVFEGT